MQYNVSVNANDGKGGSVNQNVQLEADNLIDALDKARERFTETIRLSGLQLAPIAPKDEKSPA